MELKEMRVPLSYIQPNMLAYVAGPYTARLEDGSEDHARTAERMRIFCLCVGAMMGLGIKSASPLMMHLVRQHTALPGDWAYWGDYSMVMLKKCDVMVVLKIEGWEQSTGVKEEMLIAAENDVPIIFVDPAELLGDKIENTDDGTILIKVSKIESSALRRLTIAATFVPIVVLSTFLVGVSAVGALFRSVGGVGKTAAKHW